MQVLEIMARPKGFEPLTHGLEVLRTNLQYFYIVKKYQANAKCNAPCYAAFFKLSPSATNRSQPRQANHTCRGIVFSPFR